MPHGAGEPFGALIQREVGGLRVRAGLLDLEGAFEREDGASPGRFGVAQGKAYGSVMLGMTCTALKQRADVDPSFIAAVNGVFGGQLVPVPGGVLVKDKKGAIIGSVGVSGDVSENDLAAALAGIEAAGLQGEG